MKDQVSTLKTFDKPEEPTFNYGITNVFKVPDRNWNGIIDSYNVSNKRKFPFSPEQCKLIVEYVKQGHLPKLIFESFGISNVRYSNLIGKANELDEQLEMLMVKDELSDEEHDEFQNLMRNPLRVLISDISRAEGISKLQDWEIFNTKIHTQPDLLMAKMRARYKEFFNDKEISSGNTSVTINLGGDFVSKM